MEQQHLFEEVAHAFGASLAGSIKLEGGSSANVWRLDLIDGERTWPVIFRQHQADGELKNHAATVARKEFQLLQRLGELGFPVAMPLYVDEANRFLVTQFIDGDSFVDPQALTPALDQMADLLVRIHAVDLELINSVELIALEDPIDRLRTCLPSTPAGQQLGSLLDRERLTVQSNSATLLHGDYWPGNVLWAAGQIAALIDWEDAWLGDPLADLACARVELLCQYDRATMDYFTARYLDQATHLDTRSLAIWECYASATALSSMHLWGLDPAEELDIGR